MIPLAPPYGLAPRSFGFAQLAAFAGRATLGATRETALACLIGARLVVAMTPPFRLTPEQRRERAAAAVAWLGALTLPAELRPLLQRLFEASAETIAAARAALRDVRRAVTMLDEGSRAELDALEEWLERAAG